MATKKAGGSSKNGRDSNPKMRGVKRFGGQAVGTGRFLEIFFRWIREWYKINPMEFLPTKERGICAV